MIISVMQLSWLKIKLHHRWSLEPRGASRLRVLDARLHAGLGAADGRDVAMENSRRRKGWDMWVHAGVVTGDSEKLG